MGLEKIKECKKKLGFTTEELSKKSGVSVGTLNKILSGATKDPKLETLKSITHVLDLTLDDLGDNKPTPNTIAAHFDGDEYSEEQIERIKEFARFIKSENNK